MLDDSILILRRLDSDYSTVLHGGPETWGPTTLGVGPEANIGAISGLDVEVAAVPRENRLDVLRDSHVVAIAPVLPMRLIRPISDADEVGPSPSGTIPWGLRAVGADTSPYDGDGVVVAVLDTGIDATHPAFEGVDLVLKNFTDGADEDVDGHGTHCAGTIFGRDVEGTRIGVARGVRRALIGKVMGEGQNGSDAVAEAIMWAINSGAHVISMSLGIDFPGYQRYLQEIQGLPPDLATSQALEGYRATVRLFDSLTDYLRPMSVFAQPSLVIAAAGNESLRDQNPPYTIDVSPPAVSEGVVSVAAVGEGPNGFKVASFSNTGAHVSGPGVGIVSARRGGGLRSLSGTSMATPHVAGVAALWAQKLQQPGNQFTSVSFSSQVLASATRAGLHANSKAIDVGSGLVRAPQQ